MHDGIDELDDLMQRAQATPWGKTCSALWAQAAMTAEERQDMHKAVRCYGELCAAYMMGGESTRVIAPFMWLDRMFKTRPEYFTTNDIQALGWYYKYVLSTVRCVPTVPVAQCEALLDEMRTHYTQQGDSLRAYHIRSYLFHRDMMDTERAEESYAKWHSAEHSELADCERCDPGYEVAYYARQGRWEEAVAAGDKALQAEGDFCDSQPEALLTEMMEPWLRVGRDSQAWAAHIRAYRRYQQAPRYFEYLQDHFWYLALSGRAGRPERLERGLTILARHMPWWKAAEHPRLLMDTAAAVCVLLDSFQGTARQRVLPLTLPGEDLPWAPRETVDTPTIDQAAQWMRHLAVDLARQFDARPGHRNPGAELARIERRLNPTTPPPLPKQDLLTDVTGMGEYHSSISFTDQPAGAHLASEEPHPGSPQPDEHRQNPPNEDEPPLIALPRSGDWQHMSAQELLKTSWRIAPETETIYSLTLAFYLRCHPDERRSFLSSLPPDLTRAGQWLDHIMRADEELEYQEWEKDPAVIPTDPALRMVVEAEKLLEDNKLMEAAQLADQATRTPSVDPNGVRIGALFILGMAASRAGYLDESLEAFRDATNLCALLGLSVAQSDFAWLLASTLAKTKRWHEAAEVAQNALDTLERFPQVWVCRIRLLNTAAHANEALGYHDAAAANHHQAALLLSEHGQTSNAVQAFRLAGESYTEALDFIRAIDAFAAVVPIIEQKIAGLKLELELADNSDQAVVENLKAELSSRYREYAMSLYSLAAALVSQPGQVPPADIERMESVMETLRRVSTDLQLDEYLPGSVQWRGAEWLSDSALMHWKAYQYSVAMDEQRASIAAFEQLDDVQALAQRVLTLAKMHQARNEREQARVLAERTLELLSAPSFAGSRTKREARSLLKELASEAEND